MTLGFPINRAAERDYTPDWTGEVVTCDIDRTYLATRISSLKGMAKVPLESAVDKKDLPGMAALLKEIRRGPNAQSRHTPIYFLSASPAQLRGVIQRKMLLDGLEYDGTTFKDWGRVLLGGRLKRFREQLGFKITALLAARTELPVGAQEILVGDDLESDAAAYTIYADILTSRIPAAEIPSLLVRHGVLEGDARHIQRLRSRIPRITKGVKRIYIRLETSSPSDFREFAPHVVAGRSAFQIAISLYADGCISERGALRVAADLVRCGAEGHDLSRQIEESVVQNAIALESAEGLLRGLREAGSIGGESWQATPPQVDSQWVVRDDGESRWTPSRYFSP